MEVLRIYVNVTGCHEVTSGEKMVRMLPFEGTCDGPFLTGTILSGGVDTQKVDANGAGILSARYMIEGVDCSGTACKVFIENTAQMGNGNCTTIPDIITDSPALKWLETADLRGRIEDINGQLTIIIELAGATDDAMAGKNTVLYVTG